MDDLFPETIAPPAPVNRVRCISLWQPWASLMACGAKTLETRGWDTQVRGEIYIHASKTFEGLRECEDIHGCHLRAMEDALNLPFSSWATNLPFGKIIARGMLCGTYRTEDAIALHPDQDPFGNFAPGRFAHLYKQLTAIDPIPWRGAQGFFFADIPAGKAA